MELLTPSTAKVLAQYHHPVWGKYAAITRNSYGKGEVTYIGFMPTASLAEKILEEAAKRAGLWGPQQTIHFPTVMRSGILANGHAVHYVLNYTADSVNAVYPFPAGKDFLSGGDMAQNGTISLQPWGVAVIEETAR